MGVVKLLTLQFEKVGEGGVVEEVGVWVADCGTVVERKQLLRRLQEYKSYIQPAEVYTHCTFAYLYTDNTCTHTHTFFIASIPGLTP